MWCNTPKKSSSFGPIVLISSLFHLSWHPWIWLLIIHVPIEFTTLKLCHLYRNDKDLWCMNQDNSIWRCKQNHISTPVHITSLSCSANFIHKTIYRPESISQNLKHLTQSNKKTYSYFSIFTTKSSSSSSSAHQKKQPSK